MRKTHLKDDREIYWNLKALLLESNIKRPQDFKDKLFEYGLNLSYPSCYALMHEQPIRVAMKTILTIVKMLDCSVNDLIVVRKSPDTQPIPKAPKPEKVVPLTPLEKRITGRTQILRMAVDKHWSREVDSCIACGTTERPHKGMGFCKRCYKTHKHDIMPMGLCTKCGRTAKGYKTKKTEKFVCNSCRSSRIQSCSVCEKDAKIKMKLDHGVRVCEGCAKSVSQDSCVHCGQMTTVVTLNGDKVCPACLVRPEAVCIMCEQIVKYYKRDEDGKILCKKCYRPKPKMCSVCHKLRPPQKRYRGGHICIDCYQKPLRLCSVCDEQKVSYKKTPDGDFICRDCHYNDELDKAIESVPETFATEWAEKLFLDYLNEKRKIQDPETVCEAVVRDKPLFEKLEQHFSKPDEITHETFWKHFHDMRRPRTGQLHAFLIEKGLLPHTEIRSEQFFISLRIARLIDSLPEGFKQIAAKYNERLFTVREKKLKAGWDPDKRMTGSYNTIHYKIKVVRKFIMHLDAAGLVRISEITSELVDSFIANNLNYGCYILDFMEWLHRAKYIVLKYKTNWKALKYDVAKPLPQDKYDYLIKMFMDDSQPLKKSLLCALALVYGISVNTLRGIRVNDIREEKDKLYLKLPYIEIELHADIATMVLKYLNDNFIRNPFDVDNPYLFYGYTYQAPMESGSICNIFRTYGFHARDIIPTAIRSMFDNKVRHPGVWTKVLGISRRTAARYYESLNPQVLEEMNINKRLYGRVK